MSVVPIIPGFYPDPSICRVGADYYLATSSFEYFPGVPIFHSTDLLTWTQLGNVFDRPGQLPSGVAQPSGGIYAPTLRFHAGTYWLITTDVSLGNRHVIVTAKNPAGPWSDPVLTDEFVGIDPDLTWDEAGQCRLTWSSYAPGMTGIAQVLIDPATGSAISEPFLLWEGTGLAWPESPHLYHREGWWYLVVAEGGTERGHVVSVARSRSIGGPFHGAPTNPVFTHRSTGSSVQNVGHADFFETASGEWAMVYLGVRPRGITPGFHVNGRETFLAGLRWVDDWPVIDENHFSVPGVSHDFTECFDQPTLHSRWVSPGRVALDHISHGTNGGLRLTADVASGVKHMLVTRTRDLEWEARATVSTAQGAGQMVLRLDDDHWCALSVSDDEISAVHSISAGVITLGSIPRPAQDPITLGIRAGSPDNQGHNAPVGPDVIELFVQLDGTDVVVGRCDGRYLSTEVAGGFTGRVVGVAATTGSFSVSRFGYARL